MAEEECAYGESGKSAHDDMMETLLALVVLDLCNYLFEHFNFALFLCLDECHNKLEFDGLVLLLVFVSCLEFKLCGHTIVYMVNA